MLHSRTDTAQDDFALRYLSGCEYMSYRYLVNRADLIGICYPKLPTIAEAIDWSVREVQRALDVLNDNDVFRYRRKNAFDPVTRRKLHNVYQVNPDILIIAAECEAEARKEWDALILQCGNVSTGLWSHINQHQEPTPETSTSEHAPETSTTNRTLTGQGQKQGQKPPREANPPAGNHQRSDDQKSSVPPPERPQYINPDLVKTNLPDAAHEGLASELRRFGIGMELARGFVVTYGYSRVKLAFDQVTKMGEKAREPAAVFRSIVQVRLADDFAMSHQKLFKKSGG